MSGEVVLCYSEEPRLLRDLVCLAHASVPDRERRIVALALPESPSSGEPEVPGASELIIGAGEPSTDPHVVSERLRSVVVEVAPTIILVASTKRGREVVGRLAGTLDLAAVTGVTGFRFGPEGISVDREALSGNAVSVERVVRRPAVIAILPGTSAPAPSGTGVAGRRLIDLPASRPLTERVELRPKAGGQLEIEKAERIVTIGRGLQRKDDLALIEALARSIRGEVGCTRPLAAESGWLSDDHWIGLTGHRVHPKLYIAVGVSGAVQHLVGMRTSQVVVAVNKDPNAPIFAQADYRIVGDLYQIVPALTKAFQS